MKFHAAKHKAEPTKAIMALNKHGRGLVLLRAVCAVLNIAPKAQNLPNAYVATAGRVERPPRVPNTLLSTHARKRGILDPTRNHTGFEIRNKCFRLSRKTKDNCPTWMRLVLLEQLERALSWRTKRTNVTQGRMEFKQTHMYLQINLFQSRRHFRPGQGPQVLVPNQRLLFRFSHACVRSKHSFSSLNFSCAHTHKKMDNARHGPGPSYHVRLNFDDECYMQRQNERTF